MSSQEYVDDLRTRFIIQQIDKFGRVGRKEIREKFLVSGVTASAILARFEKRYPGALKYDNSLKVFVAGENPPWRDGQAPEPAETVGGFD